MIQIKEQTRSFARSKFKTTQMDQLEEVEDIKENNLDLLMKHLNRLGRVYRLGFGPATVHSSRHYGLLV